VAPLFTLASVVIEVMLLGHGHNQRVHRHPGSRSRPGALIGAGQLGCW